MPFKKEVFIQPTATTLIEICGVTKQPYHQVLKKLWAYWKENKLNTVEDKC